MSNLTDKPDDDLTIPSRKFPVYAEPLDKQTDTPPAEPPQSQNEPPRLPPDAPWLLKRHFNGQINLATELNSRYPALPVMSVSRLRSLDTRHGLASLTTPDGMAALLVDADGASGLLQFAFSFASTLTLRFQLDHLTSIDRLNWLERLRQERDGAAFLWGASRWEQDYLVCILHKRFVNLYAFSRHQFEAAARLTPEVSLKLVNWLETIWKPEADDTEPPKLLTW